MTQRVNVLGRTNEHWLPQFSSYSQKPFAMAVQQQLPPSKSLWSVEHFMGFRPD